MIQNATVYQTRPEPPPAASDCVFYHVMDLPGAGVVGNGWDLRETATAYLGNLDFSDRRVLDVGAAGGFLSFEAERRGAREVVSFDMVSGDAWNIVPYHGRAFDFDGELENRRRAHQRMERGYWFAHHALASTARRALGDVYDLPAELGEFDVVILGMILPHLRDPFQALATAAQRCSDTLLVTQQTMKAQTPIMQFMPDPTSDTLIHAAWWMMSDVLMRCWFDLLGFDVVAEIEEAHYSPARGRAIPCTAFVGARR